MRTALSRMLSVLLALCIWTALMPFSVMAAEGDVCQIVETETGYPTLDGALHAVESGQTIQLLANINYSSGTVIIEKSVTFNLNGHDLNVLNDTEGDTAETASGLYVKGNATLALAGDGEFNVTGRQYGVYVESSFEGSPVASATVTNATATGADGCGAYAYGENATITVLGNATATGTGGIGATGNSSGLVTVKGNVTALAGNQYDYEYDCAAVEAWDDGEVIVEGGVTATGLNSIGVLAAGSSVTILGDVTGVLGGAYASVSTSIEIGGNVSSTDESGFGVEAIDNCSIDVSGNVSSGGTGVAVMGASGLDGPSEITVDGVISAPVYIRIGEATLGFDDCVLDPDIVPGYRIYAADSSLGGVFVLDVAPSEFAGGDGTEENPYLVATADQLSSVRNHLDKHFRQTADIDLNVAPYNEGEGWVPIGTWSTAFTGTFDGNGKTISGLRINRPSSTGVGLFGAAKGATFKNLALANVEIVGNLEVAGLAGIVAPQSTPTQIADVHLTDGSVSGTSRVGGLVGALGGSNILRSSAGCDVIGVTQCIGGLVGQVDAPATISECHVTGNVTIIGTGEGRSVGGLVGNMPGSCSIDVSYASGEVMGKKDVGGLVGYNAGQITRCFADGAVEGTEYVGGLVGNNYGGQISRCFANGIASGTGMAIGGLVGQNVLGGTVENCYAMGAVQGMSQVGGLVGWNPFGSISHAYATGQVTGTSSDGGLIGEGAGGCTESFWDIETSGIDSSACGSGAVGKTTAEMKQQTTYVDWDFAGIWDIRASQNGGYPFLSGVTAVEPEGPGAPPALSEVGVASITDTTATLNFTSDKAGIYYYLVYAAVEAAPDAATIKAQGEAAAKGTDTAVAAANTVEVGSLTASTAYKAYVIVEDADGRVSDVAVKSFSTLAAAANNPPHRKADVPAEESASVTVNTAYTLDLSAIFGDADSDPLTYTVSVGGASPISATADYVYTPTSEGDTILVFRANDGTADSTDTYTVTLTADSASSRTYALTIAARAGGSITAGSDGDYVTGAVINVAATPSSGYRFNRWSSVGGGAFGSTTSASTTFTMPANAASITANFSLIESGGGGDDDGPRPSAPSYEADVTGIDELPSTLPIDVKADNKGALVDLEPLAGYVLAGNGTTLITVPSIPGVDDYTFGIPASYLSGSSGEGSLTVETALGNVTISANMLSGIPGAEGTDAKITIGQGDTSDLPDEVQADVGDRPLVHLTLTLDGERVDWSNPDASVTISIPYEPTAEERQNPNAIVIWSIDGAGNPTCVANGHYDAETGTVTFQTTHCGLYAVGYNSVSFNDVAEDAWYADAVEFIAAREITTGTGNGSYSPKAKLTRGDFVVLVLRAYGISSDENPIDNFADAGDTYYTGYLAAAKRLGISSGIGNNMYAPDKEITRQEMFTLLHNTLKVMGLLPHGDADKRLSDFADAEYVADWALEAMTLLVETGTITGSNGALTPLETTTRAEIAQVLFNLLGNLAQ